ncbi:MAG: zinc ribbon domain-containing protein [Oscillospiraceae bacterium]|nr:zinc ribbon domain-containing protein [Oscillospiraceae bacterium]
MSVEICQSCGMKMQAEDLGKNADGSANHEYCKYCYPDGKFSSEVTMDDMIEHNLKFLDMFNKEAGTNMTPDQARAGMRESFPELKRWKK